MKILAISDVPSKLLWDESVRKRLEGIDLILSCGDLPKKYLEYLTNFTTAPILYVHGNHDGSYKESEPGGCICVDDAVYVWKGLRIMGLGGCNRYNRDDTFQYTEAEMRRRARKLWLAARRAGGTRAGDVVDGGTADGCRKRIGSAGVHGQHAALRATAAGDLGHERAAAVGFGHGRAVGNQVDFARDHNGAAGVAGERHGGIAGSVYRSSSA